MSRVEIEPSDRSTSVTTGLKWAPDTAPNVRMSATRAPAVADRVLEQLEADVVGREAAGHDARPDDGDEEEAAAERLGSQTTGEVELQASGAGLGLFVETTHPSVSSSAPRTRAPTRSTWRPRPGHLDRIDRAQLAGGHLGVGEHGVDLPRAPVGVVDPHLVLHGEAARHLVLDRGVEALAGQAGRRRR